MRAALQFGWDTLRAHTGFLLALFVIVIACVGIPGVMVKKLAVVLGPVFGGMLNLAFIAWQGLIGVGVLKICLKLIDKQKAEFSDLFSGATLLVPYIVAKLLLVLIILGGVILLIVPGIIWAIQFYMCTYLVVDKGLGPIEALKKSSALTRGARWELFCFSLLLMLLNIAGGLAFGIGLLISLPVTTLASLHVYRQLLPQTPA